LSNWFRDYLYISLGGNRKGNGRTYFNLFIVFLLTGLWHGASWNFVIWGLIHGLFIIIERLGFGRLLKKTGVFQNIYTLFIVLIAWVFFRFENFNDAYTYINRLLLGTIGNTHYNFDMFLTKENTIVLLTAIFISFNGFQWIGNKLNKMFSKNLLIQQIVVLIKTLGLTAILIYSIMNVASGSYDPFIYFRF